MNFPSFSWFFEYFYLISFCHMAELSKSMLAKNAYGHIFKKLKSIFVYGKKKKFISLNLVFTCFVFANKHTCRASITTSCL